MSINKIHLRILFVCVATLSVNSAVLTHNRAVHTDHHQQGFNPWATQNVYTKLKNRNLKRALHLIRHASRHFEANDIERAKSILLKLLSNTKRLSRIEHQTALNAYAYLLQHQHQFQQALAILNQSLTLNSSQSSAWSQKIQIQMTLGQLAHLRISCKQLWALRKTQLAAVCQAALLSGQGKSKTALQFLTRFYDPSIKRHKQQAALHVWFRRVYVDIAVQAQSHRAIAAFMKTQASAIKQDAYLTTVLMDYLLDQHNIRAARKLASRRKLSLPLLLRYARLDVMQAKPKSVYVRRVTSHIAKNKQAILADDKAHAREIAYFYLYVTKNYTRAYHYAKQNWRLQKEAIDRRLLTLAKKYHTQTNSHTYSKRTDQ